MKQESQVLEWPWETVFKNGRDSNFPDDEMTVEMQVDCEGMSSPIHFVGYHLDNRWWVHCEGGNDMPLDSLTQKVISWKY